MMNREFYKLMLVTRKLDTPLKDYLHFIEQCAQAGITAVQLREKSLTYNELLNLGRHLQTTLAPFNIPLIINDHVDVAIELDACGVHLGQADGNPFRARERLGSNKWIGISINTPAELERTNQLPIDYVGIGAIYPTKHKNNITTLWGVDGLKQISPFSKHPIVAIGGIDESNAKAVMQAGAHGIAVIGAIHDSQTPDKTIHTLRQLTDNKDIQDEITPT
jgi:thiamine-phosphate pyrophosphorylase